MPSTPKPQRQLPRGVTRGLWQYAHTDYIADDYDDYFAFNALFDLDEQVLARHLTGGGLVVDLGCGTGRALLPLARRGFRGLAVDLSGGMLQIVREKARLENLPIQCVRANMVQLDFLADDSADHVLCLFSTLGMVRGRENRQLALMHARRILRPGGLFVVHVHNYWYNLSEPGGPWWLLSNLLRATLVRDVEAGDKFFHYRGIPNMFLHVFTRGRLTRALRRAGFRIQELIAVDPTRRKVLPRPWLLGGLRAIGWIVVCE